MRRQVRAAIEGKYPGVVECLHKEDDVTARLHDLVIAVVTGAKASADARNAGRDAAHVTAQIPRTGGRALEGDGCDSRGLPTLSVGSEGRDLSIRRIDDERSSVIENAVHHFGGAGSGGGVLVLSDVPQSGQEEIISAGEIAIAVFEKPVGPLLELGDFGVSEKLAAF